ncbi:MAG: hypothetical protein M9920_08145 [Verrucomicrobiae bacterium]|nr:hypothetical protein [Verrucomicrobiae bacterium]
MKKTLRRRRRPGRHHLLIALLFLTGALPSEASEYLAQGHFVIHDGKNLTTDVETNVTAAEGGFSVWVKNCNWLMRWTQSNEPFDYQECGTDGRYVYSIYSVEQRALQRRREGRPLANEFIGTVEDGSIPNPGTTRLANVLWWTLASGCYLSTNTDVRFPPIRYMDLPQDAYLWYANQKMAALVERDTKSPFLPSRVVFMDDGLEIGWPGLEPPDAAAWKQLQETRRLSPYENGFTNCVLSVLNYTNLAAGKFPVSAVLRTYAPVPHARTAADLDWRRHLLITVTNLQTENLDIRTTVPRVPGNMFLADARFIKDKPVVMTFGYITPGEWPSEAQAKQTQSYREAREASLRAFENAGITIDLRARKRALILGLFILFSALALVYSVKKLSRNAKSTVTQQRKK